MLSSYEDKAYLVQGFRGGGFRIGYKGDHCNVRGNNSKSITENITKAEEKLSKNYS